MKVGIIGAGAIVRRGHLPSWKRLQSIEVSTIADVNEILAKNIAKEFNIPRYSKDYQELLDDPSIEIVDIATPTPSHSEIVLKAIKKKKHILVEKPLAFSLKEAKEIHQALKGKNLKLNIVQNYRYYRSVAKVKERLESGRLGKIVSMNGLALAHFPVSWTRSNWLYHQGGVLYDFAPHLVDLVLWLHSSQPKNVTAFGGDFTKKNMEFITHAQILIEFEDSSTATMDVSWLTGTNLLRLNVHGTGGHVFLDVKDDIFLEIHGTATPLHNIRRFIREIKSVVRGLITGNFFKGPVGYYHLLLTDFIKCITDDLPPPTPVEQGLMVNAVIEAAQKSIETKKAIEIQSILSDSYV